MSHQGIEAMTLAGNDIFAIADGLSPGDWTTPVLPKGGRSKTSLSTSANSPLCSSPPFKDTSSNPEHPPE